MSNGVKILGTFDTWYKGPVVINRPMPSVHKRGPHADPVDHDRGNPMGVRIPNRDKEAISQASKLLGMTRNDFIRWCATHVAHEILKKHNEYMKLK